METSLSRNALIVWAATTTQRELKTLEELASGVHFCLLLGLITDGKFVHPKLNYKAKLQHQNLQNLKLLNYGVQNGGFEVNFDIVKISNKNITEILSTLQWFHKTFLTRLHGKQEKKSQCKITFKVNAQLNMSSLSKRSKDSKFLQVPPIRPQEMVNSKRPEYIQLPEDNRFPNFCSKQPNKVEPLPNENDGEGDSKSTDAAKEEVSLLNTSNMAIQNVSQQLNAENQQNLQREKSLKVEKQERKTFCEANPKEPFNQIQQKTSVSLKNDKIKRESRDLKSQNEPFNQTQQRTSVSLRNDKLKRESRELTTQNIFLKRKSHMNSVIFGSNPQNNDNGRSFKSKSRDSKASSVNKSILKSPHQSSIANKLKASSKKKPEMENLFDQNQKSLKDTTLVFTEDSFSQRKMI